ncbi:hypothetical protein B0H16DRAFT_1841556 [Mycena metata]|uniref:Uncharacterized protein n=1 Tax=Mycena metata TaxID=1033252 RepID=A0AAD7IYF6_9AGAR|nr:hypothetical protein B0H16DRAFT_1841556 [Mycena metata]
MSSFLPIFWEPTQSKVREPQFRPHYLAINRCDFSLGYVGCVIPLATVGAGAACTGSAFFANVCILFAEIMFFCMALNLQLVLIHGVNGQSMEKYYVTGAVVMTVVCTIPPYAAGALGFYPDINTCWFNSPDPTVQLRWFVGTVSLWLLLLSAGEVVCFFMIVGSMGLTNLAPTGFYPLVSCFFTVGTNVLDLHSVLSRDDTEVNWRLTVLNFFLYTLRPVTYALLAATDPSFLRALRALRGSEQKGSAPSVQVKISVNTWRSSATSSTGRPSDINCDTEIGLNSIKAEDENAADGVSLDKSDFLVGSSAYLE